MADTTPPPSRRDGVPAGDDLRGLVRLGADGVVGLSEVVEAMHEAVLQRAVLRWVPFGSRLPRVSPTVHAAVRGVAKLAGRGGDALLAWRTPAPGDPSERREALVAALNGVCGDHLARSGNPLAIPLTLRMDGRPVSLPPPAATGRIAVLVHGLAMNDLQWHHDGHDHGQALAQQAGFTPVYVHYNTGLHVSENGRTLSERLDELVQAWPVPIETLVLVGHSMGGLVARSACHVGRGRPWLRHLRTLVCLGTPHHGAPLERAGRWADLLLGASPFAAPLARVAGLRSAGITDLRHGNVQDADWRGPPGADRGLHDRRVPTPWPRGVRCCVVAAVLSPRATRLSAATVGDGLVPLDSAWGRHADRRHALPVRRENRLLVTGAHHWDLLSRPEVGEALVRWTQPAHG